MTTLQAPSRPRQCKPLSPIQVRAEIVGGATPDDLARGVSVLSLLRGDDDETFYWVKLLFARDVPYAIELTRFGTHDVYQVSVETEECSCPDAVYRSRTCKHVLGLRQALPTIAAGKAVAS
jgi:hypothetical protein